MKNNPYKVEQPTREVPAQSTNVERIRDLHKEMRDYVKGLARSRRNGELQKLNPHIIDPHEYEGLSFLPNLYDVEPAALDDLEAAKKRKDQQAIDQMRTIIRAFSWTSHGPMNPKLAAGVVDELVKDAKAHAPQDLIEWEALREVVANMECRGPIVETATRFIEKKLVETWKDFLNAYRAIEFEDRPQWPTSLPANRDLPIYPPEIERHTKRMTALRSIRDELYYQRLYPNLCAFGHQGVKK